MNDLHNTTPQKILIWFPPPIENLICKDIDIDMVSSPNSEFEMLFTFRITSIPYGIVWQSKMERK